MTLPSTVTERLECLRDLGRTMQGGSILVLGRRRLYPVRPEEEKMQLSLSNTLRSIPRILYTYKL